jgi:hypothetical protein
LSLTPTYHVSQSLSRVADLPAKEQIWQNVSAVCELFDMARDIKMLELRRRHPLASEEWILSEALSLIELGCR